MVGGTKDDTCFQPCGQRDSPGYAWYCVRSAPQAEPAANRALINEGLCAWLPREEIRRSNRQTAIRLLLPCYQFVQLDYAAEDWRIKWANVKKDHRLRLQLLGMSRNQPTAIPWPAMRSLLVQIDDDGILRSWREEVKKEAAARLGLTYMIGRGPWSLFTGICSLSEPDRVCLLLSMFGRQYPTWVDVSDIELVA